MIFFLVATGACTPWISSMSSGLVNRMPFGSCPGYARLLNLPAILCHKFQIFIIDTYSYLNALGHVKAPFGSKCFPTFGSFGEKLEIMSKKSKYISIYTTVVDDAGV